MAAGASERGHEGTVARPESGRVLVACVAENSDRWYTEAANLVLSVRSFGGALAQAAVVVNFVEAVAPRYVEGLAELGAEVRVVERFDRRNPPSNKLRMLELVETHDFDLLVMIDTDTVVVGDISEHAVAGRVGIKPENRDPYPDGCWEAIYRELGIAEPSRSTVMTSTAQVTFPYFNSGVLMVPRQHCHSLRESWTKRVHDVLAMYERRPDIVPPSETHWTNQLALALAVVGDDIPVAPLPVAANLSTTVAVHPMFQHQVAPPFVLHFHNEMDVDGFVLRSRNRRLNPVIDTVNRRRGEMLGVRYDGLGSPPLVKRILRRIESRAWYETGPFAVVRRHRLLRPLRNAAKRAARGRS